MFHGIACPVDIAEYVFPVFFRYADAIVGNFYDSAFRAGFQAEPHRSSRFRVFECIGKKIVADYLYQMPFGEYINVFVRGRYFQSQLSLTEIRQKRRRLVGEYGREVYRSQPDVPAGNVGAFEFQKFRYQSVQLVGIGSCQIQAVSGFFAQTCIFPEILERGHNQRDRSADIVCRIDEESYLVFIVLFLHLVPFISENESQYGK